MPTDTTATPTVAGDSVAAAVKAFSNAEEIDAVLLAAVLETRRQQQRRANSRKKSNDKADTGESVDEQIRMLPRKALHGFCDAALAYAQKILSRDAPLSEEELLVVEVSASFATILVVDAKEFTSIDQTRVFDVAVELHAHLLRLKGEQTSVQAAQDAISSLCEAVWTHRYTDECNAVITQMLPYLIVRSYDAQTTDHFQSKRHPVRRLHVVRDALLELDFQDESSTLLRDILLRCFIQPNFFRSPDAVAFLGFLFELHVPFILDINDTIRNQIPSQRKSILKKFGAIYFKAWVGTLQTSHHNDVRACIEEACIQRYIHDAVHAGSLSLFSSVRTVLQVFFDNKRHAGVDEMLYRISSPILWRGVKAANDSVRRQAAVLLFDHFPLRDPGFNHERLDRALQKQFDAFEDLLGDSHPAVRIAAVHGVAKVLSVYWELLPAETLRCFIAKLVVDLVNDAASSGVRAAVFEALQFILDNHNSHAILKPLLPMLAPLINDRHERVRAEFAALLVRIKSIRDLHFYDVVSVDDLLARLVLDRDSAAVRKQLVVLFLNSYFPQGVGGSSQVARCLALVKKNPEAALVFYRHVADHASVGSVCKLAALLCRCSLNFVAKRLEEEEQDGGAGVEEKEEEEKDENSFSEVGRVVVLELMACLVESVRVRVLTDERYAECRSFLAQQLSADSLVSLLLAYSQSRPFDAEALCAIWQTVGYLGELTEGELLEPLLEQLMVMDPSSSQALLAAMVDCLARWHQLPFLVAKIEDVLTQWREDEYADSGAAGGGGGDYRLHPTVALTAAEYLGQATTLACPTHLLDRLSLAVAACAAPVLALSVEDVVILVSSDRSVGVLRLLEVHAKLLAWSESARVTQQTGSLLDAARATSTANHQDALAELQPSAFFSPPLPLATLLRWVARVLLTLRTEAIASIDQPKPPHKKKPSSKRRRDGQDASPGVDTALVNRWRNLFSLVALLSGECLAFALQREAPLRSAEEFGTAVVDALCECAREMQAVERAVVFHACHLLAMLERRKRGSPKGTAETIAEWTVELQHALGEVDAD